MDAHLQVFEDLVLVRGIIRLIVHPRDGAPDVPDPYMPLNVESIASEGANDAYKEPARHKDRSTGGEGGGKFLLTGLVN